MNDVSTVSPTIVHIPDKPPVPPDQQPTVDVVASVIKNPKDANTLIRRLNQIAPLENLRHVKRIQKRHVEGGKIELSVILCLHSKDYDHLSQHLEELIQSFQLSPFITKVCKYAATSREEWDEQCKLWPTSFHPPTYNIDGITGFSEDDSQSILSFMKVTIELAKSGDNSLVNAAVIVDPIVRQIIASGHDEIYSWNASTYKASTGDDCFKESTTPELHPHSNGLESQRATLPNDSPNKLEKLGVSCLNPRGWSHQQPNTSSCYCHPLRHAVIVAIESSAERDRRLFPSVDYTREKLCEAESMQSYSSVSPAKRQKTNLKNVDNGKESDADNGDSNSASERPYLCTGFDAYLVWEPCTMCAMALVHQRIRRIFYAFPNPKAGALGSIHRLQGEKSLNHHYAVFRVMVPEEVLLTRYC
ncbi:hypothetical protein K2173_007104 [Erythroxylum novogranatense]|uniref:CMP/dCMP-type deaminase domain-containing protein n=1 Tax=Erythroxylum novogranatense TaxID=1862640 RepID=A0AAV8SYD8_9ROSI|nr:hypothetical protein K2173_007104 [Erythroxylum novogranatense]